MVGGLLGVEALDRGLLPKLCPARRPGRPCGMQSPPWPHPSRVPTAMSAPLSPCPVPAQAHGSRLRLYQLSPADSGEYMCRVVSSSGSLEASIMVTVEASGSSAVPVSGKSPYSGARRLERGEGGPTGRGQVGCSSRALEQRLWSLAYVGLGPSSSVTP